MEDLAHEETRDASVYARRTVSGCSTTGSMPQSEAARAVMAAASEDDLRARAAVFGSEIQSADDNFCELRARKIRGWFKGCLCHAVENAVGRECFNRLLCCNSLCVGECWRFCQTRGMCRHAGLRCVYVL